MFGDIPLGCSIQVDKKVKLFIYGLLGFIPVVMCLEDVREAGDVQFVTVSAARSGALVHSKIWLVRLGHSHWLSAIIELRAGHQPVFQWFVK